VIACEYDDRRLRGSWVAGMLKGGQLDGKTLEPSQRARRLCQLALAPDGRLAMDHRRRPARELDPIRKHGAYTDLRGAGAARLRM
jgi:hypothetical protein